MMQVPDPGVDWSGPEATHPARKWGTRAGLVDGRALRRVSIHRRHTAHAQRPGNRAIHPPQGRYIDNGHEAPSGLGRGRRALDRRRRGDLAALRGLRGRGGDDRSRCAHRGTGAATRPHRPRRDAAGPRRVRGHPPAARRRDPGHPSSSSPHGTHSRTRSPGSPSAGTTTSPSPSPWPRSSPGSRASAAGEPGSTPPTRASCASPTSRWTKAPMKCAGPAP